MTKRKKPETSRGPANGPALRAALEARWNPRRPTAAEKAIIREEGLFDPDERDEGK